jgi:multicomponent Na+:H+ antiporter subunit B
MIWQIDLLLLLLLVVSAVLALRARDLIASVAVLGAFSFFVALLFAGMGAVDVAFVEAVLGSAFVAILFIAAVASVGRGDVGASERARPVVLAVIAGFVALMIFASVDLPDRGDPDAPAHVHVSPDYIERSLAESDTPNVVTAVLADFRSHDTLGETLVIFTAALAVVLILSHRRETEP